MFKTTDDTTYHFDYIKGLSDQHLSNEPRFKTNVEAEVPVEM